MIAIPYRKITVTMRASVKFVIKYNSPDNYSDSYHHHNDTYPYTYPLRNTGYYETAYEKNEKT